MDKSLIFVLVLVVIAILIVVSDFNLDENIGITITEESANNNSSIGNLTNNTNLSELNNSFNSQFFKTYDKNGIYFKYPSNWGDDFINNILSFGLSDNFGDNDYKLMVLSDDSYIEQRLESEQENSYYSNYSSYEVDGKKAYLVSANNDPDFYSMKLIIEKDSYGTYFLEFYCDKSLSKNGEKIFMDIIKSIKIQNSTT